VRRKSHRQIDLVAIALLDVVLYFPEGFAVSRLIEIGANLVDNLKISQSPSQRLDLAETFDQMRPAFVEDWTGFPTHQVGSSLQMIHDHGPIVDADHHVRDALGIGGEIG